MFRFLEKLLLMCGIMRKSMIGKAVKVSTVAELFHEDVIEEVGLGIVVKQRENINNTIYQVLLSNGDLIQVTAPAKKYVYHRISFL